jgi:hypothetical protein
MIIIRAAKWPQAAEAEKELKNAVKSRRARGLSRSCDGGHDGRKTVSYMGCAQSAACGGERVEGDEEREKKSPRSDDMLVAVDAAEVLAQST